MAPTNALWFSSRFDEPHEKFMYALTLIAVFSILYSAMYASDPDHVKQNKEIAFDMFDFAAFSTLNQIGVTFGDVVPKSRAFKALVIAQVALFWYIALN